MATLKGEYMTDKIIQIAVIPAINMEAESFIYGIGQSGNLYEQIVGEYKWVLVANPPDMQWGEARKEKI
jgi:hypothetical protein